MINLNNLPMKITEELQEDFIDVVDVEVSKQVFEDSKIIFDCLDTLVNKGTTVDLFLMVLSNIDFSSRVINDNINAKINLHKYNPDKRTLVDIVNFIEGHGTKEDFYSIPEIIHCYKSEFESGHMVKEDLDYEVVRDHKSRKGD